jgi:hypothetical protein
MVVALFDSLKCIMFWGVFNTVLANIGNLHAIYLQLGETEAKELMCTEDFEAAVLAFLLSCSWCSAATVASDDTKENLQVSAVVGSAKKEREPKLVSKWFAEKKKWAKDTMALINDSKTPAEIRMKATSLLKVFNERQILFCPKEQTELHDKAKLILRDDLPYLPCLPATEGEGGHRVEDESGESAAAADAAMSLLDYAWE